MLVSKVFFGMFAGAAAVYNNRELFSAFRQDSRHVTVNEYYHRNPIVPEDVFAGRLEPSTKNLWALERIGPDQVQRTWLQNVVHWTNGFYRRTVYFQTYFRAPPAGQNTPHNTDMDIYLFFEYSPETEFHWAPEITDNRRFKHVETHSTSELHYQMYKVACRPGSVFPIRLLVVDVQLTRNFSMTWSEEPDFESSQSLDLRLVKMDTAALEYMPKEKAGGVPVIADLVTSDHVKVLLSRSTSMKNIRKYSVLFAVQNGFIWDGYIKPSRALTRFVLSSSVSALVNIHASGLTNFSEVEFRHFASFPGYASEMIMMLDPNKFHKITVWVALTPDDRYELTLMACDPTDDFTCDDIYIEVPNYKKYKEANQPQPEDGVTVKPKQASASRQGPNYGASQNVLSEISDHRDAPNMPSTLAINVPLASNQEFEIKIDHYGASSNANSCVNVAQGDSVDEECMRLLDSADAMHLDSLIAETAF